ncbi:MAG: twin-arginine translocase subunit TatC [Actinomycetes bacterium]
MEHLRELRSRIFKALIAVFLGSVVGWIFYEPIFNFISEPILEVADKLGDEGYNIELVLSGVAQAFLLQLKIATMAGVVLSSPIWIYQLWAFVTPGLHRHERRYALGFLAAAVPLFLLGVGLALWVLPKGLSILIGFTPQTVSNFLAVDTYLSFLMRLVIVFGISFLTPVLIVALNFMGILRAETILRSWRWTIVGVFVFAAVATPTPDPFTMLLLATPILVLISIAFGIALLNDRRRARSGDGIDYDSLDDDEASPIGAAGGLDGVTPIDAPDGLDEPDVLDDPERPDDDPPS